MLDQITRRLNTFLAHPASAKFAFSARFYNLMNATILIRHQKDVKCNICGWEGHRFKAIAGVTYIRYNAICPGCGSAERHRALVNYMNKSGILGIRRLICLDIGPIKGFQTYFETRNYDYISVDLDSDLAMVKMDATRLAFVNTTFDLIICSHVLEHVKNDMRAIEDMFRVLKSGGACYILVPFDKNRRNTIEYDKPNPLDPLHVRAYGLDVVDRIKFTGFRVSMLNLVSESDSYEITRFGLGSEEICFICTK